jgi:hypothetical protein
LLLLSCSLLRDIWVIGWAADHADEIFELDGIDALTAYVRVNFSNEDLEGKNFLFSYKIRSI